MNAQSWAALTTLGIALAACGASDDDVTTQALAMRAGATEAPLRSERPEAVGPFGATLESPAPRLPTSGAVWSEHQVLAATNVQPGSSFGFAVALDGETAVIGAHTDDEPALNSGSALVVVRLGDGWQEEAKLVPSDGAAGDGFGYAVGVDGDTAVVGAFGHDANGDNSGAAYVFVRDAMGVWSQEAKLLPSDGEAYENFGIEVAIDGDRVAIGAHQDDDMGGASGSVYLFVRSGGVWTEVQKIVASDGAILDLFGRALALEGGTLAIGAPRDDDMGEDSGSVYVLTESGGLFAQSQKLTALDGASQDNFGFTLGLSGDTLVVGAHQSDAGAPDGGAAYVFERDAGGAFVLAESLVASDAAAGDRFARELAISGDRILVGAWECDDQGAAAGAAYVFARNAFGEWLEEQKIMASNGAAGDSFGRAVAIDDINVLVGAYGMLGQSGAVYAFSTEHPIGVSCAIGDECFSGRCIDDVCCDALCDGACDRCDLEGTEGICTPVPAGEAGESCSPYLCDGSSASCPTSCESHGDCEPQHHCSADSCVFGEPPGEGGGATTSAGGGQGAGTGGAASGSTPPAKNGGCAVGNGVPAGWPLTTLLLLAWRCRRRVRGRGRQAGGRASHSGGRSSRRRRT